MNSVIPFRVVWVKSSHAEAGGHNLAWLGDYLSSQSQKNSNFHAFVTEGPGRKENLRSLLPGRQNEPLTTRAGFDLMIVDEADFSMQGQGTHSLPTGETVVLLADEAGPSELLWGENVPCSTVRYAKGDESRQRVLHFVESLYADHLRGCTTLRNREAIDFAASTDEPVLIVGESGVGKEFIADAIARRWFRRQENKGSKPRGSYQIVNCAGLSAEFARAELFGYSRGAFTGADKNHLGRILKACGLVHEDLNAKSNEGVLQKNGHHLEFRDPGPFGVLLLDEFGELPLEVQTLLLRYLGERHEVSPLGSDTIVSGANLKIIAATSDPRVAGLVGHELMGAWRSRQEMEAPLRQDLLFRLKSHVIRAEPITGQNVRAFLECLIRRSAATQPLPVRWTPEAIDYVCAQVQKTVERMGSSDGSVEQGKPAFGHRRELDRVVRMANAFVAQAAERGFSQQEPVVTRAVIDQTWRPSFVVSYPTSPLPTKIVPPAETVADPGISEQTIALRSELSELIAHIVPITREEANWWKNFRCAVHVLKATVEKDFATAGIDITITTRNGARGWNRSTTQAALQALFAGSRTTDQKENVLASLRTLVAMKEMIFSAPTLVRERCFGAKTQNLFGLLMGIPKQISNNGECVFPSKADR